MIMGYDISDYFRRATGKSARAIAKASGIEPTTLNRQLNGSTTLTVETVVAVCRAFNLDMADALVEAGFITDEEAERLGARVGLGAFTDLELAREIVKRIENGEAGTALTGDLPDAPVVQLRANVPDPAEDDDMLAAASDSARTRHDDRTDEDFL